MGLRSGELKGQASKKKNSHKEVKVFFEEWNRVGSCYYLQTYPVPPDSPNKDLSKFKKSTILTLSYPEQISIRTLCLSHAYGTNNSLVNNICTLDQRQY
uniref:Uncharacterized protein n=1 Tax=Lepeophtheirus salmonis TaxID=72036 RepID=A0A0K2SVE3_LEPSM